MAGRPIGSRDTKPRKRFLTLRGRRTRRRIIGTLAVNPAATVQDLLRRCNLSRKGQGNMQIHLDQMVLAGHLEGELGALRVTAAGLAWAARDRFLDQVRPQHKDLEGQALLRKSSAVPAPPVRAVAL